MAAIHTQIRKARDESGLTREQMAPMLGVALRTLQRYETGGTARISVETLCKIGQITGQPLSFFLVPDDDEAAA